MNTSTNANESATPSREKNTVNQNITTAQSSVSKASDDLENANQQLAGALAVLRDLDAELDGDKGPGKGYGARAADATAQVQSLTRLVGRRETALTEARQALARAEAQAKADRIDELGDILAGFDRDVFVAEVVNDLQLIVDRHLEQVYELKAAEAELRQLAGKDPHPTDRVSINRGGGMDSSIDIDGTVVYPAAPEIMARNLGELIRDSRYEAEVNAALAEQRAEADAERVERAAEAKAFRESENVARWGNVNGAPAIVSKRDRDGNVSVIRR